MGADGARSFVRQSLGFHYLGEGGAVREFMGGRMHAMYIRVPDFYSVSGQAPAWMNVTFNRDRRAFMAAVDGKSEFAFHTQLRADEDETALSDADAIDMFQAAMGAQVDVEILSRGTWRAGFTLVVERMQSGRIFLGGDAAHLFTPAGGLGYNTAIEDAVNLGWKLAAVVRGAAPHSLLASYEQERRPAAVRNTNYARRFAESLGANIAPAELEDDSPAGAEARTRAGEYFNRHARKEFNIPGITFGCRYDGSPIIVADGDPPPDRANVYIPTSCPGGRAPHLWLGEDRSLYDEFGFEWTLLRLGPKPPPVTETKQAFADSGLELKVLDIPGETARDLYETDLALIRPDQVVAFRGREIRDPRALTARVSGRGQPETDPYAGTRLADARGSIRSFYLSTDSRPVCICDDLFCRFRERIFPTGCSGAIPTRTATCPMTPTCSATGQPTRILPTASPRANRWYIPTTGTGSEYRHLLISWRSRTMRNSWANSTAFCGWKTKDLPIPGSANAC